jgi:hypothetical protein
MPTTLESQIVKLEQELEIEKKIYQEKLEEMRSLAAMAQDLKDLKKRINALEESNKKIEMENKKLELQLKEETQLKKTT